MYAPCACTASVTFFHPGMNLSDPRDGSNGVQNSVSCTRVTSVIISAYPPFARSS